MNSSLFLNKTCMRKIKKVLIEGFWGDRKVTLDFNDSINFLIGVNGSGKTTIINLIAASLNADFAILDKIQFKNIRIDFFSEDGENQIYIKVEKKEQENSPYSRIIFNIQSPLEKKLLKFDLNSLEEENLFRTHNEIIISHKAMLQSVRQVRRNISAILDEMINLTWLSIHRVNNNYSRDREERNFESSIDKKINDLSSDLVKYFGVLDKNYSQEADGFQKNVLLSLIDDKLNNTLSHYKDFDSEKEKDALRQVFLLFKLNERDFTSKLEKHFKKFEESRQMLHTKNSLDISGLASLVSTGRIHSVVQEWNSLNEKKIAINKPKYTFLQEVNNLFQRKEIFINERNELFVKSQSGKILTLNQLSSGEKQLLIILGQGLLQENKIHIYIADEPELSLHIEWQEKLVSSIKNINPNAQIIFATHSPDIVGAFSNAVIKVEDVIQ